ncbi:hypothetical protein [Streptomyces sp. HD]|uniref:hypothetical protein n=1 Tax=Streptomyces sp. HD TaxID=3020892 RepID=UPI002330BF7E|nr:hypothetical protein [Streptomyces sp. HD]MDC0765562.1 hypothetical protein [Streptomyces sp. HD]
MQLTTTRGGLRRIAYGAAIAATIIGTAGCTTGQTVPDRATESVTTPPSPAAEPTEEPTPEPTPVISYLGDTKVVTLGNVEARVTPGEYGINVACNVRNDAGRALRYKTQITVSSEGVSYSAEFDFGSIEPAAVGRQSKAVGSHATEVRQEDLKVYIDSVITY